MNTPSRMDANSGEQLADPASSEALSPTADEVEGSQLPLVTLLETGVIEPLEFPLSWSQWRSWRFREGRRPRDQLPTTSRESRLWRQTMEYLFGANWQAEVRAGGAHAAAERPIAPTRAAVQVIAATNGQDRRVWRSSSPPRGQIVAP